MYLAMYAAVRVFICYNLKPGGNYVPPAVTLHIVLFMALLFLTEGPGVA